MRLANSMPLIAMLIVSAMPAFARSPWQHHVSSPSPQQSAPRTRPSAPPPSSHIQSAPSNRPSSNGGYTFHPQGPGPHNGDWLRKYMAEPPSQQEQQLRHDPNFQRLPPERQSQLVNRLRSFNSQPPEQKARILNRMETFEHMTPQQQQMARNLYGRYRNLPEDQKNKVSQAYRRLRGMPPSARNELLNSPEFRNHFTDDQRDLLRGMTDLNVPPGR